MSLNSSLSLSRRSALQFHGLPCPLFLLHTSSGCVPHLTPQILQERVFPKGGGVVPPLLVPLDTCLTFAEGVRNFGNGIGAFSGHGEGQKVMMTLQDPRRKMKSGYNPAKSVALWSRTGKSNVDVEQYKGLIEGFKPTYFQGLSDYDVTPKSGVKRFKKSIARNIEFFDALTSNSYASQSELFLTIELSWFLHNEEEAIKTVKGMLNDKMDRIHGFILAGANTAFNFNSDEEQEKSGTGTNKDNNKPEFINEIRNIDYNLVEKVLAILPTDKPRYIPGPFNPEQIVELSFRGLDLFDSSYVTGMAEQGQAFVLDKMDVFLDGSVKVNGINGVKLNGVINESLPTKENTDGSSLKQGFKITSTTGPSNYSIIGLKNKEYFNDFSPISEKCECYTCRKHTRAYINHLYVTDELLAPVLIMIHNLAAFKVLFQHIQVLFSKDYDPLEWSLMKSRILDKLRQH